MMEQEIKQAGARIVERSWLARIARWVLKSPNVAMVLGRQIHLSGVTKADFLKDRYWVEHELCHVQQYKDHGLAGFLSKYVIESCRKGYYHNKFEVEARNVGREKAALYAHQAAKKSLPES